MIDIRLRFNQSGRRYAVDILGIEFLLSPVFQITLSDFLVQKMEESTVMGEYK